MLWQITTDRCSVDQFSMSEPHEVLYDYDGPKIFTTKVGSMLRLWYACGEDRQSGTARFLIVPASDASISQLKAGIKTVHDALSQPWLWAVDVGSDGLPISGWALAGLSEVPRDSKPEKDAPLWPSLVPFLAYRLIGAGLGEGTTPSSVISRAVEKPTAAVKRLLELASNTVAHGGRPANSFRKQYDMVALRMAFNSFEISFSLPAESVAQREIEDVDLHEEGAKRLRSALTWLRGDQTQPEPEIGLLEVLQDLVPPAHGQVERTEIKGALLAGAKPVELNRADRTKVRQAIARKHQNLRLLLETEGLIREFDKDNLTFILRDRPDNAEELSCAFSEQQYDDLYEAFDTDARIAIHARWRAGRRVCDVVAVEQIDSLPSPKDS